MGETPGSHENEQKEQGEEVARPGQADPSLGSLQKESGKQQMERILKKASETHKQRVEDFNRHMDILTEHCDIPKVSWTKSPLQPEYESNRHRGETEGQTGTMFGACGIF